jgi:hypothetical protein
MRQRWTDPAAIEAEIARIRSLPLDALRRRWRLMFGRTPPAALSKDLLGRMMACRLQEQAFGSLDRESLRFLDGLARHGGAPRRQLKPGTVSRLKTRSASYWKDCAARTVSPSSADGRHCWKRRRDSTVKVVCSYYSFPSPMRNATGKLSNISPTDSALPAESTSLVITFRQAAGAPLGIFTCVSRHTCLPRGNSPS